MRQLLAFVLLVSFLAQSFSGLYIVADYYINTGSFAKNCENKDKPIMKCNGKCQMMKQLAQEKKKEQENPERKAFTKNIIYSSSYFASVEKSIVINSHSYPQYKDRNLADRSLYIFHPPPLN